jgi:hypothetical protein
MTSDKEFRVHKFILAARSSVLCESIIENPEADAIDLFDIPSSILEILLNYMYDDEMPEKCDDFGELYTAADKLNLTELKEFVVDKLEEDSDNESVDSVIFNGKLELTDENNNCEQLDNEISYFYKPAKVFFEVNFHFNFVKIS